MSKRATMFADGGSRGNPGPAASGAVLFDEQQQVLAEVSAYLGVTTNNQAEYHAIVIGLQKALDLGVNHLDVFLDSELAVKQLNGEYKVKNPGLAKKFIEVHNLRSQFSHITFSHVRREKNTHADRLVNEELDRQ